MNNNFYTPENIEAYLENKLSPADKASFESAVAKDPLLQNEVTLQSDIVQALKDHRKAELKNRLNKIEIAPEPKYGALKIAASIVATGLIGLGIYTYYTQDSAKVSTTDTTNVTTPVASGNEITKQAPDKDVIIVDNKVENNSASSINDKSSSTKKNGPATVTRFEKRINSIENNVNSSSPEHSTPADFELQNEQLQLGDSKLPEGKIGQATDNMKSNLQVSVDNTTSNKFHYKYHDNKLFLFGDFESKTYSILEINPEKGGKQVYFQFDNNYYLLTPNQMEPAPLKHVNDRKLVEQLEKFNK